MEPYYIAAFVCGVISAALFWKPNDPIPGMIIYQLYYVVSGKIYPLLGILDQDNVYEGAVKIFEKNISYLEYIEVINEYTLIAPKRLLKKNLRLLHLYARRYQILHLILLIVFIRALAALFVGLILYLTLRWLVYYFTVVVRREPELIVNVISADAVDHINILRQGKSSVD